ncbi:MAG: hypothetical protein P8P40_08445, partial [Sulfitobacter sp.]|nr:hypothetical protein [Sulfitobacter sp.]
FSAVFFFFFSSSRPPHFPSVLFFFFLVFFLFVSVFSFFLFFCLVLCCFFLVFFGGRLVLALFGFVPSVLAMAGLLGGILCAALALMPKGLPMGRKDTKFSEVFSKNRNINWLSLARLFLFGARDVWFVVGIPIYFYAVLSDGSTEGNRAAFFMIGTFMAVWTILYGAVQAAAPRILRATKTTSADKLAQAKRWLLPLIVVPLVLSALVWSTPAPTAPLTITIVLGLLAFGAVFAVNSALHSYLILSFTDARRVTMDVGFYYMANAAGRLVGTVLSGLTYQTGGLPLCLLTAATMIALGWCATAKLQHTAAA